MVGADVAPTLYWGREGCLVVGGGGYDQISRAEQKFCRWESLNNGGSYFIKPTSGCPAVSGWGLLGVRNPLWASCGVDAPEP